MLMSKMGRASGTFGRWRREVRLFWRVRVYLCLFGWMQFLLGNIYATDCLLLPFLTTLLPLNLSLMVGSRTCLICAYGGVIVTWLFLTNYGQRLASSVFVLFLWVMRNMCRDVLGFLVLFPCLHRPIL